ncbi:hypothetical protein D3C78_1704540 [compost metagenome]
MTLQPGHYVILYRRRVTGGEINGRALIQQPGYQRGHFQIQVHVTRQAHAVQIR